MAFADPTEHPRPQLIRPRWRSLDGEWDYHADPAGAIAVPDRVPWDATVNVPFAPETPASGIGEQAKGLVHWYRRTVDVPDGLHRGQDAIDRLVVHFGAVDHHATVWIDGAFAGTHEGGYTPFSFDVPEGAHARQRFEIVVRAYDDPDELDKPRGKQTWRDGPSSIWYPRTSGIWRTVWLEAVPATAIESLRWTGDVQRLEVGLDVRVVGPIPDGTVVAVRLSTSDDVLVDDRSALFGTEVSRRYGLGADGRRARDSLLWSTQRPNLIDAHIELQTGAGAVLDVVRSYTGLRSVELRDGRVHLNGRPIRLRMVLDQGYWPDTGLTPPDTAALRRDVELTKALGFNGVRKHQKVEDPRYLAWADRLGLMVWSELPSAQAFSDRLVQRAITEWGHVVVEHRGHPSVVAWVPFNESWGVPDLLALDEQRAFVRTLTAVSRALDGSRPVISNDGWEIVGGDVAAIHDYDGNAEHLASRYADRAAVDALLAGTGPSGRQLVVEPPDAVDAPVLVTEFGGISLATDEGGTWGYHQARDGDDLAARYGALVGALRASPVLAGFCYTQLTDTYQEANGLLTMHRIPKAPLEAIRAATRGRT